MPKIASKTPEEILRLPYERVLIPEEEGGFSANIAEFEGCFAQGETADEALSALHDTALEWIQAELEDNKEIPKPWIDQQASGKLLLRLPKSLHQTVIRLARREGVSVNQYLVSKIAAATSQDSVLAAVEQRISQFTDQKWRAFQACRIAASTAHRTFGATSVVVDLASEGDYAATAGLKSVEGIHIWPK